MTCKALSIQAHTAPTTKSPSSRIVQYKVYTKVMVVHAMIQRPVQNAAIYAATAWQASVYMASVRDSVYIRGRGRFSPTKGFV